MYQFVLTVSEQTTVRSVHGELQARTFRLKLSETFQTIRHTKYILLYKTVFKTG